jgi:hypothetical protein
VSHAESPRIAAVGVVVPARDEETRIERCLHGLVLALRELPRDLSCTVCLVLDRCADRTAERALAELTRHSRRGTAVSVEILHNAEPASVGSLRDCGLRRTLRVLSAHPLEATWLLSTDADSVVDRTWALDHLRHADQTSVRADSGRRYPRRQAHSCLCRQPRHARECLSGCGRLPTGRLR